VVEVQDAAFERGDRVGLPQRIERHRIAHLRQATGDERDVRLAGLVACDCDIGDAGRVPPRRPGDPECSVGCAVAAGPADRNDRADCRSSRENPNAAPAEVFPGLSADGRRRSEQPPCCDEPQTPLALSAELDSILSELFDA